MSVLPLNFGMCRCMCGFLFGTILFCCNQFGHNSTRVGQ